MASSAPQFLAMVISDDWVRAAIWQQVDTHVSILNTSELLTYEQRSESQLNEAIDSALDQLGDAGLALQNVIYVLPHHWILSENSQTETDTNTDIGDLKSDRKNFLKRLSQDLVLEPLGFVILTDTIAAHETARSGLNFSGLIWIDSSQFWDVAVFQNGSEIAVERIGKSGDSKGDLQELQARLSKHGAQQPARILFLAHPEKDSSELESLLNSTFQTSIETLSAEHVAETAILAGGEEVLSSDPAAASNPAASESNSTENQHNSKNDGIAIEDSQSPNHRNLSVPEQDAPLLNAPPVGFSTPDFTHNFSGNSSGNSASVNDEELENNHTSETKTESGFSSPDFLVVNHGIQSPNSENQPLTSREEADDNNQNIDQKIESDSFLSQIMKSFAKSSTSLRTFFSMQQNNDSLSTRKKILIGGGTAGLIGLILIGSGIWFGIQNIHAQVDIWLRSEEFKIQTTFLLETDSNTLNQSETGTSSATAILPVKTFTETVTLDTEVPTSGSKVVGDPAKGKVKIYNKTTQEKSFSAGTKIKTGKLDFTLDDDISIASASSQESDGARTTTFGTAEVNATSVGIGADGNVSNDTTFSIANFDSSSYEAKAAGDFSGGSSRDIQAVAQKDITAAVAELKEAGTQQLREKIQTPAQNDESVILPTDDIEITDITPSVEVGEEAKFVRVQISLTGTGLRIASETIQDTARTLLADQVLESQTLLPESISVKPGEFSTLTDGSQILQAELIAKGVPTLQASELINSLKGLYVPKAEQHLHEDSRIDRFEISLSPNWLAWIRNQIPYNYDQTKINIRIDRTQ